jgi:hypothetical protein
MPAKLPNQCVALPDRPLSDLQVGESGYILWRGMTVDEEGCCYLDPRAAILKDCLPLLIEVTRTQEGFHVRIVDREATWRRRKVPSGDWYPVIAIEF